MKSEMQYIEAKQIADNIVKLLQPHCDRIEIAGSIRREKAIIGDIEIVAIPKPYQTGLFADGIASIVNQWQKVKGELDYLKCKYTQRILPDGIKLDLFLAEPGNWGLILAIRTGSAKFSHSILANGWAKRGYKSEGGYLTQNGKTYDTREEIDLFNRIGLKWIEPKERDL